MTDEWIAQDGPDPSDDVQELEEESVDLDEVMQEALDAVEKTELSPGAELVEGPTEIEQMEAEIADLRDRAVRTLADFDNFRKRTERDRSEERRYAALEVSRGVLPAVDNLERALTADAGLEDLRAGVELTLHQIQDVLSRVGVQRVEASPGTTFDPSVHEAVTRQEDPDATEPTVASELQVGYTMYDRLLRPAMVAVAVPAPGTRSQD